MQSLISFMALIVFYVGFAGFVRAGKWYFRLIACTGSMTAFQYLIGELA